MEFLDKIKEVAADVVGKTEKKSKEVYGVAKLRLAIADKQNTVKKLYKEIGFGAYKAYKSKENIESAITPFLQRIDSIEDEIAALRKKIDDAKSLSEEGIEDIPVPDETAQDADFVEDGDENVYDEAETEPIDPIE